MPRNNGPVEFMQSILGVYGLTPEPVRAMRDVSADHVRNVMSAVKGQEMETAQEMQRIHEYAIQNIPGFVRDLLDLYFETSLYQHRSDWPLPPIESCGSCGRLQSPEFF